MRNAATCILTRTKKYQQITPVLTSLHGLSIKYRTDFKILLLTFKALHGSCTSLLYELAFTLAFQPTRSLRSDDAGYPVVQKKLTGG